MYGKLLICATASINVININHYIVELKQHFDEVNILFSPSSKNFINTDVLKLFCDNLYDEIKDPLLNNINIVENHEYILVLPASANTINKIANGICDNLLTTVCLTGYQKLFIFPNMNIRMWGNPFLQKNIDLLKNNDVKVYSPDMNKSFEISSGRYKNNITMPNIENVLNFVLNNEKRPLD
uniref:EPIDERMIN MODIFYING ENZYME EPID n=1 Tax=Staphylococcus epidermidis TaxID=1282 RepID=UPI0000113002|nr:Chain A, EPIDERMIN MODIFYING ENZYME EPID [Staphylococcus epidermidis]1G5Q_D Chain D, EPIDERMIN MODIFYING ENZYME EPID [Staphylococcus epidermidis]1G5Q_G Chain G, EPIDERMIN MODIFYING ENZYME EPID [Staphylococcus epidermidis]1G5Q_L Chain L, EPIDERMIN MODIFYING ENZYME EPID [Staphylococcus epidermidis]